MNATPLTQEQFSRIDHALAQVIERPGDFDDFQVDFAMKLSDKLDRYGVRTFVSERQWAVVERIERRIEEID